MNTVRQLVADALIDTLPITAGIVVRSYAAGLDNVPATTVLIRVARVAPSTTNPQAWHRYTVELLLLSARQEPGTADDELEAALVEVLWAIEKAPGLVWTDATRATLDTGAQPVFLITLTIDIAKEG